MLITDARCRKIIIAIAGISLLIVVDVLVTLSSGKSAVDRALVIASKQHEILGRLDRIETNQGQILRALTEGRK